MSKWQVSPKADSDALNTLRFAGNDSAAEAAEYLTDELSRLRQVEEKAKELVSLIKPMCNDGIEDLPEYRHIGPNIERATDELLQLLEGDNG